MDNGANSYRRFLDGDESAFDDLMNAYFRNLVCFLTRYVHDSYLAEDLAIDAFSDLIVHRHRYHFKVSMKTYLFMIGRSRALDFLKRRRDLAFSDLSDLSDLDDPSDFLGARDLSAIENRPEEVLSAKEDRLLVRRALGELPGEMREAVYLVFYEGMSYAEAAKVMRKNPKQVDNLLYRAKKELRCLLGEDGEQI